MLYRFPLKLIALVTLATPALLAQEAPTSDNLDALREQLRLIQEERAAARSSSLADGVRNVRAAAASPSAAGKAYEEAVRILEFEGRPGAAGDFNDWKRANADVLGHPSLEAAALLHLRYLGLTLQRAEKPDEEPNFDALLAYLQDLSAARQQMAKSAASSRLEGGQNRNLEDRIGELLGKPLTAGPFVRAYELQSFISGVTPWEMQPGNWEGIINQNIRVPLRAAKDPRLISTWDLQLELEQSIADANPTALAAAQAQTVHLPQLRWGRAEDVLLLGNTGEAYQTMFDLIKSYPAHPDSEKWLERLTGLLQSPNPPAAAQ